MLNRDVLGLGRVDSVAKQVDLRFADVKLDWCEGSMPTADGDVTLHWRKDGNKLRYKIAAPAGYAVKATALDGLEITRAP